MEMQDIKKPPIEQRQLVANSDFNNKF